MKYFFSSPESMREVLDTCGVSNYLLSFAVDAKGCKHYKDEKNTVIIDSGAFTVWNKGGSIDIDAYRDFCLQQPQEWSFINLDVIPKTGSTKADIEKCCEEGYENYLYLSKYIKNLVPVYHYGDEMKWLNKFVDHTDYIGISPANDTHESVKRRFLKEVFKNIDTSTKTHGLGYSSFEGLTLFPFYSVDSISFKKVHVFLEGKKKTFWGNGKMRFLIEQRIKEFLNLEKYLTELWDKRGIKYEN